MKFNQLSRLVYPLLALLLFVGSIWAINHQLRNYDYRQIINTFKSLPSGRLLLALVLVSLSYLVLTIYDVLGCYHIGRSLPSLKVILAAFLGHAISNNVGFAILTGSAIRYRFYSNWGLSAIEIAQVIAFSNLSFWLGIFAVGGIGFVSEPLAIPNMLHIPFASVRPLGIIFLLLVSGYVIGSFWLKSPFKLGRWEIAIPSAKLAFTQLIVASLDWILAGAVLYVLLPPENHLSYSGFFGIYLLGQIAGIISHVPGGLGVFETVILWFLSSDLSAAQVFGTLLAYRAIYYLLPLAVAMLLLGAYEIYQRQWKQ